MADPTHEELVELLSDEHRTLVDDGVLNVFPGQEYPVLRWARGRSKGKMAKGTGLVPAHNDLAQVSKDTAWKRTGQYRALLERLLPPDEDPNKRGTLAWLVNHGLTAAEGIDEYRDALCPECEHVFKFKVFKKPDTKAVLGILEMLIGRAPEQKEINIHLEEMYRKIDEREDAGGVRVFAVDPHEKARREALETIEGDFREVDD